MMLYLSELLKRRRMTVGYFFRIAHIWAFEGKDLDPHDDVKSFESAGEIPPYAVKFIHFIQDEERKEGGDLISSAQRRPS